MNKTPYQVKMEQLKLQEHNLFEIAFNKTVYFTRELCEKYATEEMLDEKSFLLRTIRRMTNLMHSVYVIFKTTEDRASMMILARSIIDLNAILCFLFQYEKEDGERALRLRLFYLDGVRTRLKISKEPLKERDSFCISEEEYNLILSQKEKARRADMKAVEDLEDLIKKSPLYPRLHPAILKNASWKYKRIDKKESYSLTELYEIACGDENMARFEQEYLSNYVHGIAISDFQFPAINNTNPFFSLTICCSILTHLDPILKAWFPDDYDNLEESFKPQLMKYIMNGLTEKDLEAYLKEINVKS